MTDSPASVAEFSSIIVRAISQKLIVGDISIEKALDILMSHILDKHHSGMRVTFFFPDYAGLKPVTVRGTPPEAGSKIYFRQLELQSTDGCDYKDWISWTVKRVDYSVMPNTKPVESLRMLTFGQEPNSYEAQVMLYKGEKWTRRKRPCQH